LQQVYETARADLRTGSRRIREGEKMLIAIVFVYAFASASWCDFYLEHVKTAPTKAGAVFSNVIHFSDKKHHSKED
jgi:hypothetical protein